MRFAQKVVLFCPRKNPEKFAHKPEVWKARIGFRAVLRVS